MGNKTLITLFFDYFCAMPKLDPQFKAALSALREAHEKIEAMKPPFRGRNIPKGYPGGNPDRYRLENDEQRRLVGENAGLIFGALEPQVSCKVPLHPFTRNYLADEHKRDELFNAGYYGLVRAVKTHEPSKGALSTYAYPLIRREVQRYLDREGKRLSRLPTVSFETPVGTKSGEEVGVLGDVLRAKTETDRSYAWEDDWEANIKLQKVFKEICNKNLVDPEKWFSIYVLHSGFGYNLGHIARVFGVSGPAIRQINTRVDRHLPEELRLQSQAKKYNVKRRQR